MRTSVSRHVAALGLLAIIALTASDASAVYHARLGRFLQRDPGPASGGSFVPANPSRARGIRMD